MKTAGCHPDRPHKGKGLCSQCYNAFYWAANRGRLREVNAAWRRAHPEERRGTQLKCKYGITAEEWGVLSDLQGGKCALCGYPENGRLLGVDHDHKTGRVRGLLCRPCNGALERLESNGPEWAARAIDYLRSTFSYRLGGPA